MTHARIIDAIRRQVEGKRLLITHVRGHSGVTGNEVVDRLAKEALTRLPPPQREPARCAWDVVADGEIVVYPHKTWARHRTPHHNPRDIHPSSWRPLRIPAWFRWLCGVVAAPGFEDPRSYWRNADGKAPCPYCNGRHNQSVHGHVGLCPSASNPLVTAWVQAWGQHEAMAWEWRQSATPRERFVLGKLAVPHSLVHILVDKLGQRKGMRAVREWQGRVLDSLKPHVPRFHLAPGTRRRRPHPYNRQDWLPPPGRQPSGTMGRRGRRVEATEVGATPRAVPEPAPPATEQPLSSRSNSSDAPRRPKRRNRGQMQRFDAAEVAAQERELRDVALGRRPQRSRRLIEVYDSEQVDEEELARRRKVTRNMRR